MSGYLRRLAATAKRHEQAIKPIIRPLYGTQRDQPMPVIEDEEVSVAPMSARARFAEPVVAEAGITERRLEPEHLPTLLPTLLPTVESVQKNDVLTPAEQRRTSFDRSSEPLPNMRRLMQPTERATERLERQGRQAPVKDTSSAPLVFEAARAGVRKPNGSNFSAPRYEALKQRAVPEKEPDEIQIHIGRIEVTAVPPPVVRREGKPTPKSPSLDEYLKRGRS